MLSIASVITVDGPSGSGKGTLCRLLAKTLNWRLLDSGSIYRALALAAKNKKINPNKQEHLCLLAAKLEIDYKVSDAGIRILLEQKDVSQDIRTEEIATIAKQIASLPKVRKALLSLQRDFLDFPGLVADGRDMGSVVFPDAKIKLFLDADEDVRAQRRFNQLQNAGFDVSVGIVLQSMQDRDKQDKYRNIAPLKIPTDALVINSSNKNIEQVFDDALNYIGSKNINLNL